MTLYSPLRRNEHPTELGESIVITWEPQFARTHFRRRTLEHANVLRVSANGALVRAQTNSEIGLGTRIAIGRGTDRGLVAVRRIDSIADDSMSDYGVQFLWLDPTMQTLFDDAVSTDTDLHFEWR